MAEVAKKIGLHLTVAGSAFSDAARLAREAEERGYSSLWVAEVSGPDAFDGYAATAVTEACVRSLHSGQTATVVLSATGWP